uniref:Reverse transcriptase domain-containing protein n=1 Tax=Trichobilharzia regenti TaxID=157069 RepID=A0AA85IY46_TRIRE|nr:unnamed protein product [Trichobilharzia regenti]
MAKTLKSPAESNLIPKDTLDELKPSGTHTPRLYGLPKVHKPGIPLLPILDMCQSPYHSTAKCLVKALEPLHRELVKFSVKDVFSFVETAKSLNVKGKKMMSLGVASLFTNVPLLETVNYICDQLIERNIDVGIPSEKVKELLLKCIMNVQFMFNNGFYRQVNGVAMGSPLGPMLAIFSWQSLKMVHSKTRLKGLTIIVDT